MIDPSHHRRPDPSAGVLPAIAIGVALVAAVPVTLWALANPADSLAIAVLLGAGIASCRLLGGLAADRPGSSDPVGSSTSTSGRAVRTDGSGEADA